MRILYGDAISCVADNSSIASVSDEAAVSVTPNRKSDLRVRTELSKPPCPASLPFQLLLPKDNLPRTLSVWSRDNVFKGTLDVGQYHRGRPCITREGSYNHRQRLTIKGAERRGSASSEIWRTSPGMTLWTSLGAEDMDLRQALGRLQRGSAVTARSAATWDRTQGHQAKIGGGGIHSPPISTLMTDPTPPPKSSPIKGRHASPSVSYQPSDRSLSIRCHPSTPPQVMGGANQRQEKKKVKGAECEGPRSILSRDLQISQHHIPTSACAYEALQRPLLPVQSKDGLFHGSLIVKEFHQSKGRSACITQGGSNRKLSPAQAEAMTSHKRWRKWGRSLQARVGGDMMDLRRLLNLLMLKVGQKATKGSHGREGEATLGVTLPHDADKERLQTRHPGKCQVAAKPRTCLKSKDSRKKMGTMSPIGSKRKLYTPMRRAVWSQHSPLIEAKCYCCETNVISAFDFECGHVIAKSLGGRDELSNLRVICGQCNRSMGNKNLEKFKKTLLDFR